MRDFQHPGRSAVLARNGMCATSHPLAAQVAVSTLQAGGNAVDAAIAGAVVLGICEPQMTGIGGDCFALIKPAGSETVIGLNGSGRAPAGLTAQKLREAGHGTVPEYSADAVTIPGAVEAFCRMSEDHGRMGIDALLAPAIHYAEEGIPVAPRVAADWAEDAAHLTGAAGRHFLVGSKAPTAGTNFRAPGQAEVLRRVAKEGAAGYYQGEVAADLVASLRAAGGCHTEDDFANQKSNYVDPVSGQYRDVELVELPPNGQGAAAILLAGILSHFDLAALDPFGAERAHIETEASKLAYDARNRFIGEGTTRLDHLLSPQTAAALAGKIDLTQAMQSAASVSESVHRETIYITVVDKDRMAVSLIYSIFHSFGSRLASDKFGVLFHNRGAGFSLEAGHPNELTQGNRPMHTIIPAMIRKAGRIIMPFGVMGGQYQAAGHGRFLTNVVDFGMDPQTAIDGPRAFAENGVLELETSYSTSVFKDLEGRGHNVQWRQSALGGAQAIWIRDDHLMGGSDPRKDGCALGY